MLSINDDLFQNWWTEMVDDTENTDARLNQLQMMIDQGLNIDEKNNSGFTMCDLIMHNIDYINEVEDSTSETHLLHLEQILLWLYQRITPTEELIKSFEYNNNYHMLEEILKRYEGPLIDFNGLELYIDFLEVLIGFDNVVDTIKMEKIYRKAIESKLEWIVIEY